MLPAFLFITMCMKWGSQGSGGEYRPPPLPTLVTQSSWSHQDDVASYDEHFGLNNTNTESDNGEHGDDFLDLTTDATPMKPLLALRRGGGGGSNAQNGGVLKGGKAVITRAASFWKSTVGGAVDSVKSKFRSEDSKKREALLQALEVMPVRQVVVPNSTVLPPDVVRTAVKRSGIIGGPLKMDRVQELARNLKRWYMRQGYVLHSVTGASLDPDTATASISVEEPLVSGLPVDIVFCKEMVVDDDTGELVTFKKYRAKKLSELEKKRPAGLFGRAPDLKIDRSQLNTTLVPTTGRTDPTKIAKAMKLKPGTPFRWLDTRWGKIASSGIFSKVLKASPEPTTDGGVCLQVYAMEPPPRHLEYGIGKSVWTNSWEGEVDFDWRNIFGGGESVGVMVRRGTKDSSPSIRLRYGDDKFGLEGGYDVEAFSDFLGDTGSKKEDSEEKQESDSSSDFEDSLLSRRGTTFRLRNPISPSVVANSVASASLERTSTTTGQLENIGSASLTLGPFRRFMPMDGKTSVSTTISGGARLVGKESDGGGVGSISFAGTGLLPYSSASATTKQILPITLSSSRDKNNDKVPISLALQHTVSASTPNLPRHEAKAMGNSAQIRGAVADDSATTVVKGTTEIRVPVAAPKIGSGSVVLFGDWFCAQKDMNSPFYSKSSIGVGLRKNIQGLPLKYDVCYSSEGKIKTMFGMGADFDV
ncbi:unnamed protein product [Pseudo-nitzschia multistriata]|uniref:Bacterial surface antigen (D15) domain-containing protein n=1 Tax=Pseudo-nitzschia multistriata TaxID=183589 RepID=A0A448Z251_9STRA|nr:unnamed protein product [Pseudo-nitzschia multistriata]